jgi:Omp85 superfamily domain
MRTVVVIGASTLVALLVGSARPVLAQSTEQDTRQAVIEAAAAEKAKDLKPYAITTAEKVVMRIERRFTNQVVRFHPFLQPAYSGGGFAPGAGYTFHPSAYGTLDVRGSYSIRSYKLAEAEYNLQGLFDRRAHLNVRGGWRDATQVAFHGVGMDSSEEHLTWGFEQPFGSTSLTVRPTRGLFLVRGGFETAKWDLKPGEGSYRSVDEVFTKQSLPGLDAATTYLHTEVTVGLDSRRSAGYARRGGFYGVTAHDYTDRDDAFGFRQVDYEAIQHVPVLRDTFVLSLHGLVKTTWGKSDERVPFFMMPSLGSGSTLRGYSSYRFRDRHSILLQAEWRIMANRFMESAVFYDAGKVTDSTSNLDLKKLKTDYGFGLRFHAPLATVLRIDVARGTEGTRLVFAASPAF